VGFVQSPKLKPILIKNEKKKLKTYTVKPPLTETSSQRTPPDNRHFCKRNNYIHITFAHLPLTDTSSDRAVKDFPLMFVVEKFHCNLISCKYTYNLFLMRVKNILAHEKHLCNYTDKINM
jgi:hypothetical protein